MFDFQYLRKLYVGESVTVTQSSGDLDCQFVVHVALPEYQGDFPSKVKHSLSLWKASCAPVSLKVGRMNLACQLIRINLFNLCVVLSVCDAIVSGKCTR